MLTAFACSCNQYPDGPIEPKPSTPAQEQKKGCCEVPKTETKIEAPSKPTNPTVATPEVKTAPEIKAQSVATPEVKTAPEIKAQ